MPRYFIELKFKGTKYAGWQRQKNSLTIQELVDKAISTILKCEIFTTGCGRTDSGVHARYFVAHFDYINEIDKKNFIYKANAILPEDIAIFNIYKVQDNAHARYSAISRTYEYIITKKKDPFEIDTALFFPHDLNLSLMNNACEVLKKYEDFSSFAKSHSNTKSNICKIFSAYWLEKNEKIIFKINANRFLRNMVRAIVGTMLEIGQEKINLNEFIKIIESNDRSKAGKSVDAKGLFLVEVKYPQNIFL